MNLSRSPGTDMMSDTDRLIYRQWNPVFMNQEIVKGREMGEVNWSPKQ